MGPNYKDYYATLGVGKSASEKEIKSAYRKLARKFHPDVNPGNASAEDKFKEISEAHEVLSDPEKRKKYDQFGDQWKAYSQGGGPTGGGFPGGFGGFQPGGNFRVNVNQGGAGAPDLQDLFETLFGGQGMGGGFSSQNASGPTFGGFGDGSNRVPARGGDIESEMHISLQDAYHGVTRSFTITVPAVRYDLDRGSASETVKRVEVKVPAGIGDGQKVRLAGQGRSGPAGNGDVLITVRVDHAPGMERKGDDLIVDVPVPYTIAALGGEVKVPTLKGTRLSMKLPAGSQSGQSLRLGGQGMPRRKEGGFGDLYARIKITVPKTLTERERTLLTELAELSEASA